MYPDGMELGKKGGEGKKECGREGGGNLARRREWREWKGRWGWKPPPPSLDT